jgi:Tfp pilus assembly protein PilN
LSALALPRLMAGLELSPKALALTAIAAAAIVATCWGLGERQVAEARRELERTLRSQPAVGYGLDGKDAAALHAIQQAVEAQQAVLAALIDGRVSLAAKLDALARSLPDGVWLTGLQFRDPLSASGRGDPQLTVNGACYRIDDSEQLTAIQEFEAQVKTNAAFMSGFDVARLGQTSAQVGGGQHRYTYQTFDLTCQANATAIR